MGDLPRPAWGCSRVLAVLGFFKKHSEIIRYTPFIKMQEQREHENNHSPRVGIQAHSLTLAPFATEAVSMSRFKLHISHYVIAISGFAHDQPVWSRNRLKVHKGPTVELTIAFPQDPPERFNVPFPVTRGMLRKLAARHSVILWPDDLRCLHESLEEFAGYIADNHSWFRPYRPFPDGSEDCVALVWPVTAKGKIGSAEADELGGSWFQ